MNTRYILNSAVITAPGTFTYRLVSIAEATAWLARSGWVSTIGYEETAKALEGIGGIPVPVNRTTIKMAAGDEALVFRLVLPPGERRVPVDAKGRLSVEYVLAHCEVGILFRAE